MLSYALAAAVSAAACLVQTVSGFGFGIFSMAFFPYFMPSYAASVSLTNLLAFSSAAPIAFMHRTRVRWRVIWPPLLIYPISNALVIRLAARTPDAAVYRLLGAALILLSLYFLLLKKRVHIRATPLSGLIAGGLGGALNGLFSMGGPPMVLYFLAATRDEGEYIACAQAYFTLSNAMTLLIRAAGGQLTVQVFAYYAIALAALVPVGWLGERLRGRMEGETLRRTVYALMAVSGFLMLLK